MLCVCQQVRWFILSVLLETCCISFFVIDMLDGRWRWGGVLGGLDFLQIRIANVWFIRPILYKDTVINCKFLFSGTRVKYLDHAQRACLVCLSQYMRFGRIAYLQKPLIIIYIGVSIGTRCLKVVWSLPQHSYFMYFVYARCKSSGKAMRVHRLVGAFATRRCKNNQRLVCWPF